MILASGDQVANDVMGIRIIQEWYPNMAANKIGMYAWYQKQIAQAVKVGWDTQESKTISNSSWVESKPGNAPFPMRRCEKIEFQPSPR